MVVLRSADADTVRAGDLSQDELDDDEEDERAIEAVEWLLPVAEEPKGVPFGEHLEHEEDVESKVSLPIG